MHGRRGVSRTKPALLLAGVVLLAAGCTTSSAASSRTAARAPAQAAQAAAPKPASTVSQQPADLPVITFTDQDGNAVTMQVEIANTEALREYGLMNRTSMPDTSGMIFTWPGDVDNRSGAFWMKDTLIDLQIAFVAADGTIVTIDEMLAETETYHFAAAPYRYAIEANAYWYDNHHITAGSRVDLGQVLAATPDPAP
jgi:uncharacterized membrane protein (UPF0127 family)